ncbi:MFS transporter [Chloroflexi bacterium TSY]|nr:MFS transporter [Chloroflexi bacterium TSY]
MTRRLTLIAIGCAALAAMVSTGIAQSFGLFLIPISEALGTGRETFSLAAAINSIIYGLPLIGILSDRFGPRVMLAVGGLLYVAGLYFMTIVQGAAGLHVTFGVMIGFGLGATSYVIVLGAVAPLVPADQRSRTFGFITAAGSAGMFVVPPIAGFLLNTFGWQEAFIGLAGLATVIILLALGVPRRQSEDVASDMSQESNEPFIAILKKAQRNSSYLLLIAGFFVCGFHVAFIKNHLPPYMADYGLSDAAAAGALSLIGGFNIVGSFAFGWLGDYYRKKYLLSFIYFARAVVIALFLAFPISELSALVFAGTIGFLWLATVPITSGTVAQLFGTRYLATLYGIVFFSHQVGAFLGVWLGGRIFDAMGTYDPVWYIAIALGIFAGLVHFPIVEKPIATPQPA